MSDIALFYFAFCGFLGDLKFVDYARLPSIISLVVLGRSVYCESECVSKAGFLYEYINRIECILKFWNLGVSSVTVDGLSL